MTLSGIDVTSGASPDDVVVTVGGQQAIDLISRVFLDPGDVVLAEGPSYVGALGVFQAAEADVVHVPMDDDGLIPAALSEAIAAVTKAGKRAKFLYTVPAHQNPAGVTLPDARRDEILAICQAAGLLIVEDDPYGLLGFDGETVPAFRSRTPRRRHLRQHVLQDVRAGPARRVDPGAARGPREAGDRVGGADPVPERVRPGDRRDVLRDHAVAAAAQDVPRGVPGATRCRSDRARMT